MWLDLLVFGLLLGFTALGAWRGALESGLRLAGWTAGYGAAVYAARAFGDALASSIGAPAWLGMPIAGMAAFLLIQAIFAVAIAIGRRGRDPDDVGSTDRVLGACFGAARGGLIAVLIGWLGLMAGALRGEGVLTQLPPVETSLSARWSGVVVETGVEAALGSENAGARMATALAARPRETMDAIKTVLENPGIARLQEDRAFWAAVDKGNLEAALALPSARALAADAGLRQQLAALGLVSAEDAATQGAFERAFGEALGEAIARLARLRNDPELRALLDDPEVLGLVERRDAFGLLTHPRLQSVLRRASAS